MSARRKLDMHRIQELIRLYRMGMRGRGLAQLLKMGRVQVNKHIGGLAAAGLLAGEVNALPSLEQLRPVVVGYLEPKEIPKQEKSTAEAWKDDIETKWKRGAQAQAIYDALRLEKEHFTASVWSVKRLCARLKAARGVQPQDVAIPVQTPAGDVAQVDFGYVGLLFDPASQKLRKAWVFLMVLGYSRHQYAEIVFDQKASTWVRLHMAAFEWFGGVPATLVPDNLKAAVLRAAFGSEDDPELNRSYRELARHYGFTIDPTPPRSPKKKGKVESGIRYVKSNFMNPRVLTDATQANQELRRWVLEIAGQRDHGTIRRKPLEMFEQEERAVLRPLPAQPYQTVIWKSARVHPDGQIEFERRLYPVPWQLIGQKVWVRAIPSTVEVYSEEDARVATHPRGQRVPPEVMDLYLPENRRDWRHRDRGYWEERAGRMGTAVAEYIEELFDSDDELSPLRKVQAIVTHLETFPRARAQAACERAQFYGNYSLKGIRNILRQGLDMRPLPAENERPAVPLVPPRYTRPIEQMLPMSGEGCVP